MNAHHRHLWSTYGGPGVFEVLRTSPLPWSPQFYQLGPVTNPILQMKKWRHRETTLPKSTKLADCRAEDS